MSTVFSSCLYERYFEEESENQQLLYLSDTPSTNLHLALQNVSYGILGAITGSCRAANQHRAPRSPAAH